MKIKVCAVCGRVMNEDEDTVYAINEGTDREYIECEQCHDQEWEVNAITNCEGCGRWFSTDILQSEEVAPGHTFCPCPVCGKDVVDGLTKEEFMEDVYIPKFSVVVRFCNQSRGYIVSANSRQETMKKLVDKIDMTGVDSINIAEILLDEDVF